MEQKVSEKLLFVSNVWQLMANKTQIDYRVYECFHKILFGRNTAEVRQQSYY